MSKNPPKVVFHRSYQSLLGAAAWSRLHPDIRQRFGADRCRQAVIYRGVMQVVFMSVAGWLLAQVCRLIGTPLALHSGKNVAVDVQVYPDPLLDGMTWDRYYFFPGKKVNRVRSTKCIQEDAGLIEVIGSGFGMYLAVYEDGGALCFKSTRFFFTLANRKIVLPHLLTPGTTLVRQAALVDGRFQFSLEVRHPILGLVYYQVGSFGEFQGASE
ncbi:MAG: DUF4166 domain-containing protein [Cellvibrionaceae bacterium]